MDSTVCVSSGLQVLCNEKPTVAVGVGISPVKVIAERVEATTMVGTIAVNEVAEAAMCSIIIIIINKQGLTSLIWDMRKGKEERSSYQLLSR